MKTNLPLPRHRYLFLSHLSGDEDKLGLSLVRLEISKSPER